MTDTILIIFDRPDWLEILESSQERPDQNLIFLVMSQCHALDRIHFFRMHQELLEGG